MNLNAQDKRGLLIGLIVGLIASAGVAAASGTPVYALMLSAVTVVLVLVLVGLALGLVRR
ncbi:hypothetical protein [Arthrobacter sp. NicSoilC5]|uniref:hypothetical protein n=1 Tax=Arthrobacter sp. NicSoilC5 TaxID=2831000 RepID=UPI001CC62EF6|nr:hypothetical protein [Arthrobacter sp. NicSoilC5]BCW78316.1 hypothetical protein NicSoilC5_03350 [Arthrobacter sp. NicSoilC5]